MENCRYFQLCPNPECNAEWWEVHRDADRADIWHIFGPKQIGVWRISGLSPACPRCGIALDPKLHVKPHRDPLEPGKMRDFLVNL